jgi:hypothetical protein
MTNRDKEADNYLWDGSGEPDPEIEQLERLLAPLRGRTQARTIPRWTPSLRLASS